MDLIECSTCLRMFANDKGSGVCPAGHHNAWADEDEMDRLDYLGKVQG